MITHADRHEAAVRSNIGMLLSLQHSDSFFPSGAMAFSWGLESLMRDGLVTGADSLAGFIEAQILHRWATFDQGIVSAAWQLADTHARIPQSSLDDPGPDKKPGADPLSTALIGLDQFADAMTLPPLMREGSRRLGMTLINVHARLGTASALQLQRHIAATPKAVVPHLAVVQGYLWQRLGMGDTDARMVSAHTVCISATSAAVRLGLVGHLDAQRIVIRMQPLIATALTQPAPALGSLSSSMVATDIAVLRHGRHDARLFAN